LVFLFSRATTFFFSSVRKFSVWLSSVTQPTISHHLRILREAGWIAGERRGTWIWYSIKADAMARYRAIGDAGAQSAHAHYNAYGPDVFPQ
jgi:DNA-binding transcriptional ArsR family regulator